MSTTNAGNTACELVSVVIPLFNVEKTLPACLDSVARQTHKNLEVVCINDGSTDATLAVAQAYAARDERIRVIDKPNAGYGAACNRGMDEARGTWLAIVEPDDELEPCALEALLSCAGKLGGAAAVDVVKAPYWRIFPAEGERETRVRCAYAGRVRPRRQPFSIGEAAELLRHHPSVWAALYRLDYLREQGIRFVEAPGAGWTDNPFMAQTLLGTGRIAYTETPVYRYYERDLREAESFAGRAPEVPLTRWNEMWDVVERRHVTDERVLRALALRGVNYALITVEGAGEKGLGPQVQELLERSMRRIPAEVVASEPAISPAGRRLYARACGLGTPRVNKLAWYAHLAGEAVYRVRANGLGFTIRTVLGRRGGRLS